MARRQRLLTVDDPILVLVAQRNLGLVRLLEARGHGAEGVAPMDAESQTLPLPRALNRARSHPAWSRLGAGFTGSEARDDAAGRIAGALDAGL